MDDLLVRIKRAVLAGRYLFSEKASMELEADGLTESDVAEAILNAVAIYKTLRSRSPRRQPLSLSYRERVTMLIDPRISWVS